MLWVKCRWSGAWGLPLGLGLSWLFTLGPLMLRMGPCGASPRAPKPGMDSECYADITIAAVVVGGCW